VQQMHDELRSRYVASGDSLPEELRILYDSMNDMYEQMAGAHSQLMIRNKRRDRKNERRMMSGEMGMHMQSHRTGEWYRQLQEMHERMARLHRRAGSKSWAKLNEQLAEKHQQMRSMLPGLDRPSEVPFNDKGRPEILNGQRLFATNCASCHGADGQGVPEVYPPIVGAKWITGPASIPIRILLHGMQGEIQVKGEGYNGYMPSFQSRLSIAEITAIVNFLRSKSDSTLTPITQDQAIEIGRRYRDRTMPWTADELQAK